MEKVEQKLFKSKSSWECHIWTTIDMCWRKILRRQRHKQRMRNDAERLRQRQCAHHYWLENVRFRRHSHMSFVILQIRTHFNFHIFNDTQVIWSTNNCIQSITFTLYRMLFYSPLSPQLFSKSAIDCHRSQYSSIQV